MDVRRVDFSLFLTFFPSTNLLIFLIPIFIHYFLNIRFFRTCLILVISFISFLYSVRNCSINKVFNMSNVRQYRPTPHQIKKNARSSHCNKNFLDHLYSLRQRKEAGNFFSFLFEKILIYLFFFFWKLVFLDGTLLFFNIVNEKKSILWSRKPNFLTNSVNKLQCGIYLLSKKWRILFYSVLCWRTLQSDAILSTE